MNNQFDELAKSLAQSVTRRGALKKFGAGLAGIALAALGLVTKAQADPGCKSDADCGGLTCCKGKCVDVWFDRNNCGACGRTCSHHLRCNLGTCERTI